MRSGPDSCVYIVEAENGMFKIGVTINVKQRALAILNGSPIKTRLVATFPGTYSDELKMHERFKDARAWGEWFYPTATLREFVDRHRWNNTPRVEWADIRWNPGGAAHSRKANEQRSAKMKALWATPERRERMLSIKRRYKPDPSRPSDGAAA